MFLKQLKKPKETKLNIHAHIHTHYAPPESAVPEAWITRILQRKLKLVIVSIDSTARINSSKAQQVDTERRSRGQTSSGEDSLYTL